MTVTVGTRTDGSYGRTKSNATAPTDLDTQLEAPVYNNVADGLIAVETDHNALEAAIGAAGAEVLWSWNGTDVSQFGDGVGGPSFTQGTITGALSVEAPQGLDMSGDDVLEYIHTGNSSVDAYYMINDLPTLPEAYTIVCRCGPRAIAPYDNTRPGVVFMQQDSTHLCHISKGTSSSYQLTALNDVDGNADRATFGSTTALPYPNGGYFAIDVIARDPSGGDPGCYVQFRSRSSSNPTTNCFLNYDSGFSLFGTGTDFVTGWLNWSQASIRNVGITFRELGSAGSTFISEMQIVPYKGTH